MGNCNGHKNTTKAAPTQTEPRLVYKIILVGDTNVGKTSLIIRNCDNTFSESVMTNIEYKEKEVDLGKRKILLQIYDTAGQERFKTITTSFYRGSHGALIVYDISRKETFANTTRWMTEVTRYCSDKIQLCLVGNKADLTDKREVQFEEAQKLADEWGIPFFETSAKTASEVAKSFNTLADKIMQVDPQIE